MDDVGIKIHKLKDLKLHGKMLLADGVARDRRLDQPGARQLRRPARTGHRGRRRGYRRAPAQSRKTRLGKLASARPLRRRPFRRPRRPGRRQLGKTRARRRRESGQAPQEESPRQVESWKAVASSSFSSLENRRKTEDEDDHENKHEWQTDGRSELPAFQTTALDKKAESEKHRGCSVHS